MAWDVVQNLFSHLQRGLVNLEDAEKIGAQIGEDEELASGVENGLMRASLFLGFFAGSGGRYRKRLAVKRRNGRGVGKIESVDGTSAARNVC